MHTEDPPPTERHPTALPSPGRAPRRLLWGLSVLPMAGLAALFVAWPCKDPDPWDAWLSGACAGVAGLFWVMGTYLCAIACLCPRPNGGAPDPPRLPVPLSRGRRLAVLCHGVMLVCLLLAIRFTPLGLLYLGAVAFAALRLAYGHFKAKPDGASERPAAWLRTNILIATLLLVSAIVDLALNVRHIVSDSTWRWFL